MKQQADPKRRDFQLKVVNYALVKLQSYRQHFVALLRNQKLRIKCYDPFEILSHIGLVAYKLQLPQSARIHLVFHISLLKKFQGDPSQHNNTFHYH